MKVGMVKKAKGQSKYKDGYVPSCNILQMSLIPKTHLKLTSYLDQYFN